MSSILSRRFALGCGLSFAICSSASPSLAWVYPEHREIADVAVRSLDPERSRVFDETWQAARSGYEARLCSKAADATQGEEAKCIDYAAWSALSGDHSCSADELLSSVLTQDWVLDVADVTARLERRLANTNFRGARINALRNSDIELQRADSKYATRAGSNKPHFLLVRPAVGTTFTQYVAACLTEGAEINAVSTYADYHLDAVAKARFLADPSLSKEQRATIARAVLVDEAFALHFLQDSFAAGHVTGTWGNASQRKGTHDYYNEHGLSAVTWAGERVILTGDAWLRPDDAKRAALAVRKSLMQVVDAIRGLGPVTPPVAARAASAAPGTLDVCSSTVVPKRAISPEEATLLGEVLIDTPVPMLASGLGETPRFRAELGPFLGFQAAARGSSVSGGFGQTQTSPGAIGGLELGVRLGLGLEGVMNEAGDGLVFLDLGLRRDGSSTAQISEGSSIPEAGGLTAAIPGRAAYALRVRMPFWLLPFDMLIAGPILLLASPSTLTSMAVSAGNGGVIPWQSGIATPVGRFQFIAGREVGVTLYGYMRRGQDRFLVSNDVAGNTSVSLVAISSVALDFPVLEYRPFRTFSTDQSSSLVFQLFGAVDIPTRSSTVVPENQPAPDLKPVGQAGLRLAFDWRYYL